MDIIEKLSKETNAAGQAHLNLERPQNFSVAIRTDKSISPGMFKADPLTLGGYRAHPTTLRALKKDIFTAGHDIDLLSQPHTCASCQKELDLQFWHFCPYCESALPSHEIKGL